MSFNLYYYYLCPFSRSVKFLLDSNKISYTNQHLDLTAGDHLTKEYTAINPLQKVPAIKDVEFSLFESSSILRYICFTKKVKEHWYPKESKIRGKIDLYFDW